MSKLEAQLLRNGCKPGEIPLSAHFQGSCYMPVGGGYSYANLRCGLSVRHNRGYALRVLFLMTTVKK